MQYRLQHTAAHGQRLIRRRVAVFFLAAGIDIAGFHPLENGRSVRQKAPQNAVDGAAHGLSVHLSCHIAGLHLCADVQHRMEYAVIRSPQHPFAGVTADEAGDIGIGQCAALIDHAAQRMAPHSPPRRGSPPLP